MINELNELSLEILGAKSRWQTLVNKGEVMPVVETVLVKKVIDGDETMVEEQHQAYHVGKNGGRVPRYYMRRQSMDTIKDYLFQVKTEQDKIRAYIAKLQEDERLKKESLAEVQKTLEANSGSSV